MSESKSILARLLSKENITVQHGNYTTAYFDVKNRILGLPLWKDDNKDLYDMLVGHEVGHALFTPAEGWEDIQKAGEEYRVPGDYLNVVEDIRIERKIQELYPGIVRSFKGGYKYFAENDYFHMGDKDPNDYGLADRINIKAKLRELVTVDFADDELDVVNQAFAADTWDEVVEAARALYLFEKANREETEQQEPSTDGNSNNTKSEESDDEDTQIDPSGGSEDIDRNEGEETEPEIGQDSDDAGDEEERAQRSAGENEEDIFDETVETLRAAEQHAEDLLERNDDGGLPIVVNGFSRKQMMERVIPYSRVAEARRSARQKFVSMIDDAYNTRPIYDDIWYRENMNQLNTDDQYKEFISETKRYVNVMVKEFETRKSAYQYSRASVSRSGSLDLQRLHEYKTSDDIFQRVTTLADAKSHGMVMLIDNSASMMHARASIITQVLNLAMFCKRVNIPFDVYSFTSGWVNEPVAEHIRRDAFDEDAPVENLMNNSIRLVHVLSSTFSKRDYEEAYRALFDLTLRIPGSCGEFDTMSSTPLNGILTGMHMILKDFIRKNSVQKPIFTVLTDGDSNQLPVNRDLFRIMHEQKRSGVRINIAESKRVYKLTNNVRALGHMSASVSMTKSLLDIIRAEIPSIQILGYFVANSRDDFKLAVARAADHLPDTLREARKFANANKFVSYDNTIGYDRYFILKADVANNLDAKDDDFQVPEKAKRNQIRNAFKKYANSKKGNRILATQFAEKVS